MPSGKIPKLNTLKKVKAHFAERNVSVHAIIVDGEEHPFDRVPTGNEEIVWGCSCDGCSTTTTTRYRRLLVNNGKCRSCGAKKGFVYEKFVELLRTRKYTVVSPKSKYKNTMSLLLVQCPNEHPPYKTSYNRFDNNHGCPKCAFSAAKLTFDEVKDRFESKGFLLLQDMYVDGHTPMKCRCRCGREIFKTVSNLLENTYGCKDCVNKYIKSEIEEMCEEAGCELAMPEPAPEFYVNSTTIHYHCVCGNPKLATATIKYFRSGTRCDECVREQISVTNLERYGTENVGASEHTKIKSKQTNLEKRGVEHHSQDKECRDRTTKTCIERYGGVGNAGTLRQKYMKACKEKYDSDFYLHSYNETMMQRYGVIHPVHNAELFAKQLRSAFSTKLYIFPSGREEHIQGYEGKALNELLESGIEENDIVVGAEKVPCVWYNDESGVMRKYYPDIYIPSQNRLIEVKSPYTFSLQEDRNYYKFISASRGYKFEAWIYSDRCKVQTIVCTSNTLVKFWGV